MRWPAALAALVLVIAPQARVERPRVVGFVSEHDVARGETWASLAARSGVYPSTLARMNGLRVDKPLKAGERITIDARHISPANPHGVSLLINVPQRLLFHCRDASLQAHFPIAVGKPDWRTPLGPFTVREREENPTWDVPVSIQEEMRREGNPVLTKVPPGPKNPLGKYWLGLTLPGVGIHGTNVPSSIYRSTTHGCIRMHPDDIASLFQLVREGETGRAIYEPVLVAVTAEGDVYLEVHPDIYGRVPNMLDLAIDLLERAGAPAVRREDVKRVVAMRQGIAVMLDRELEPVVISFGSAVRVPGASLSPGDYLFVPGEAVAGQLVIDIYAMRAGGPEPVASFLAIERAMRRPDEAGFLDYAGSSPPYLRVWFHRGARFGYEFVYHPEEAQGIYAASGTPVPAAVFRGSTSLIGVMPIEHMDENYRGGRPAEAAGRLAADGIVPGPLDQLALARIAILAHLPSAPPDMATRLRLLNRQIADLHRAYVAGEGEAARRLSLAIATVNNTTFAEQGELAHVIERVRERLARFAEFIQSPSAN